MCRGLRRQGALKVILGRPSRAGLRDVSCQGQSAGSPRRPGGSTRGGTCVLRAGAEGSSGVVRERPGGAIVSGKEDEGHPPQA